MVKAEQPEADARPTPAEELGGMAEGRVPLECAPKLKELMAQPEAPIAFAESGPTAIMVCGVNGAGKTTSIAKLANLFRSQGKSVLLGAGDTFRAAAVEQLQAWGERNGVPVIAQATGADAASDRRGTASSVAAPQSVLPPGSGPGHRPVPAPTGSGGRAPWTGI